MKKDGVFCLVFFWTVLCLVATPVECVEDQEYSERDVWQCMISQSSIDQSPPEYHSHDTHTWYSTHGLVAFATSLDWDGVQRLNSDFSRDTCHHFGKAKDVLRQETSVVAQGQGGGWFHKYHSFPKIRKFFHRLAKAHPTLIRFVPSIGETTELRDIFAVHITHNIKSAPKKKPKIYIQCLIHAREWISGSVCQYFAKFLAKKYSRSKKVKTLLKKVEFVIVPVVNPDGYEKSRKGERDRFWRKNVRVFSSSHCMGVDLNRNFNFHWKANTDGSSKSKCRESYRGPHPQSEPEVKAIVKYIKKIAPVLGAIDFHSFSQLVLYPYIWTKKPPPHAHYLTKMAHEVADAMQKTNLKTYIPMRGDKFFYLASGTFSDWAFSPQVAARNTDHKGKRYRITPISVELRPSAALTEIGFILPESQILPTCKEAVNGILSFTVQVLKQPMVYLGY